METNIENKESQLTEKVYAVLSGITQEEFESAMGDSKMEPSVGLQVGALSKTPESFEGFEYKYAAARIISHTSEGKRPSIKPHYHKQGFDFVVFRKQTEVTLGKLSDDKKFVIWEKPYSADEGEKLRLDPGTVHTWRAVEGGESDFVFCCPDEHLIDHSNEKPNGDRYLTTGLENAEPAHY